MRTTPESLKRLWSWFLVVAAITVMSSVGDAQITTPHTFATRTSISSVNMNANFAEFASKALNRTGGTMTGTLIARQITAAADNTYDLGTLFVRYKDMYLSGNILTAGTLQVGGAITSGSGSVQITNSTGKIPGISSTYFASLAGASLTGLNGDQVTSGHIPIQVLATGSTDTTMFVRGDGTWSNALTGALSVGTNLSVGGLKTETGVVTGGLISTSLNDYDPSLSSAGILRLTANAGTYHITGFAAQASGRRITLINVGGYNITLDYASSSSADGNRIYCPNMVDYVLQPTSAVELWYDGINIPETPAGWRIIGR